MVTEKQLANLAPRFSSSNQPAKRGRPPKGAVTECYERLINQAAPPDVVRALRPLGVRPDATWLDIIVAQMIRRAAKGDVQAVAEITNRLQGKPSVDINLLSHSSEQIEIHVEFETAVEAANGYVLEGPQIIEAEQLPDPALPGSTEAEPEKG